MHEKKISEYRSAVVACQAWADADPNKSTAARWLKVANERRRMADDLERQLRPPPSGDS